MFKNLMRKNRLVKMTVAIVALAALVTGGYLYKDAIQSRIARTVAVVSGQEIKPLLDSESRYIRQIVAKDNSMSRTIMWQSDSSEPDAVIEYRLVGRDDIRTLSATDTAFTDNGEQAYQWRTWLDSIKPLSARIPLAPTLGNHEMYTLDWKMREPRAYLNYFDVPSNGNTTFDRHYYSYDYGDVHYVVLDTQLYESTHEDNHDVHHPDLYDVQVQWLRQDLASNTKKWTVVLMHRDPFQYAFNRPGASRAAGFDEEGVLFMPIFDEFNVDLVLSAHLHSYRNRGHVRNFERDASGPLYILTGIAGDARRPNWQQHPLDVYVAPDREKNNYMTMTVTPNRLVVRAFLADGTQIDESVIEK